MGNYCYKNFSEQNTELKMDIQQKFNRNILLQNLLNNNNNNKKNENILKKKKVENKLSIETSDKKYLSSFFEKEKEKEERIFGLKNIGLTCYMNSFLQLLFHCPKFMEELKQFEYEIKYTDIIRKLINIEKNPENEPNLYRFKNSLKNISKKYSEFTQCDSQIFGIDLINSIIAEIKNEKSNFTTESFSETNHSSKINPQEEYKYFIEKYQNDLISLEKMFLINEYRIYAKKNNNKEIRFDSSLNISLTFPNNKIELFNKKKFTLKELLDYKYKIVKNNCLKIRICNFPDILIITIIRTILGEKNNLCYIEYPETLELQEYADNKILNSTISEYKLFGVNKKAGFNRESGHYFCEIKIKNIWYEFNDSIVTPNITFRNISDQAVGLFYAKKNLYK